MSKQKFLFIKGKADITFGMIILLISLPFVFLVLVILALLLWSSPLIKQERGITKENKVFKIYKFRTIKPNASEENYDDILLKPQLAKHVPLFCIWLRKSGLDELPQVINVLKGEMSLIGPRPLMISDLEILNRKYPEYYSLRNTIKVKPGITGLWQVSGKREEGIDNLIKLDVFYDKTVSFSLDKKIFLSTIQLIFKGNHSDAILKGFKEDKSIGNDNLINLVNYES